MEAATLTFPGERNADSTGNRRRRLFVFAAWICGALFLTAAFVKCLSLLDPISRTPDVTSRFIGDSDHAYATLAVAEAALGWWLISGVRRFAAVLAAMLILCAFAGILFAEVQRDQPRPCACLSFGSSDSGVGTTASLWFGIARNMTMAGALGVIFILNSPEVRARINLPSAVSLSRTRARTGFSLVELLVAIGIVAVLFGISLPVVVRMREDGRRAVCQSNLREIGHAFAAYESQYGIVPRWARFGDRDPLWLDGIPTFLGLQTGFEWPELRTLKVLHCPSFPRPGVPTSYNLNVFAFETRPEWKPSPPVRLSQVVNSSSVYWVLESSEAFGPSAYGPFDGVYFEPHHIVSNPQNLTQRTARTRHRRGSNVLFADGHVEAVRSDRFHLDALDDGIRHRRWPE